MKRFALLFAAAAVLVFTQLPALAGSITIDNGQPSFSPSQSFSNNSISAQVLNGNLLQIFGATNIAVPNPGSGSATIFISGSFSASAGEMVSFFYDFTINLSSSVPVTFTLQATANTQLGPVQVSDSGVVAPGSHEYTGMGQSNPAPFDVSGTYNGSLTFDFGSATRPGRIISVAGGADSLSLSIPQNGLQFQVGPNAIPEPSTYALLFAGVGAILLITRRRLA